MKIVRRLPDMTGFKGGDGRGEGASFMGGTFAGNKGDFIGYGRMMGDGLTHLPGCHTIRIIGYANPDKVPAEFLPDET